MSKTLVQPKSVTQQFRDLKVGKSLKMLATHYEAPHSFARAAKIKVETRVIRPEGKKFLIEVTRIADKTAKA